MERKLAKILDGAVAIPYDNELLTQLVTICRSYKENDLFVKIDECSLSFITGIVSEDFSDYVANTLKDNDSELTTLPTNVIARLSLFSVYLTVLEESDDLKRHLYATMFMNAMILAKGRWNELSNEVVIREIYKFHITNYLTEHDTTGEVLSTSIISIIAKFRTGNDENNLNKLQITDLQTIAKDAAYYRCDELLKNQELLNISNPFARVYSIITRLVDSYQYLYYNYDAEAYITQSANGEKKNKMLSNILKDIEPLSRDINTGTSVLLRLINKEQVKNSDFLLQRKLNVIEFGLYLYYELLIEQMIEKLEE